MLVVSLIAISSLNVFADVSSRRCVAEYRAVTLAMKNHVRATDKVAADALDTADFIMGVSSELIVQSDRRVGGYGYSLKRSAQVAIDNTNGLNAQAKAKEAVVDTAMLALEDCLYGVETEASDTTAE